MLASLFFPMERANMKKRGGQRDGRWQEYLTASVEYSQTHTEGYLNARIPVAFDIECRVIYVPVHTHTHVHTYPELFGKGTAHGCLNY